MNNTDTENKIIEITDICSPELDVFARLTEVQLRNKRDVANGIFIAEGTTSIMLALDAGYQPISLLTERSQLHGKGRFVIARVGNIPIYSAADEVLENLTGYKLTGGVLCAMRRKKLLPPDELLKNANRVTVLENIADSTNVGAIFRSAAALGFDAVLVTNDCCDPLCRRSVRVGMGTIFQVPWTRIGDKNRGWQQDGIAHLHSLGFKCVAMALKDNAVPIDDPILSSIERLAVIFGTEGTGLSEETIALCDYTVKIPMSHNVDSLNVAAASAVTFWQLGKH